MHDLSTFSNVSLPASVSQQPHSIVQRRLLEGNIPRLRGEARDPSARVRSPLADPKDGPADGEERSESTPDDSTEERESPEESERSLRSDEEEEEEDDSSEAAAGPTAPKARASESSAPLTALLVQCKVSPAFASQPSRKTGGVTQHNRPSPGPKTALVSGPGRPVPSLDQLPGSRAGPGRPGRGDPKLGS